MRSAASSTSTTKTTEELSAVVERIFYPKDDSDFCLINSTCMKSIVGEAARGNITPGIEYRFHGKWAEHPRFGSQFKFQAVVQGEPHSRQGVVAYLEKYGKGCGIGERRAHEICDRYTAQQAIEVLKRDPERVSREIRGLRIEDARKASAVLIAEQRFQETRVDLLALFAKRYFPGQLVDDCVKRFGVLAPKRIKHDPFTLLVNRMRGCGFGRVDGLYCDLGLPKDRLKRQLMCALDLMAKESTGSTWHRRGWLEEQMGMKISSGLKCERAIELGVRGKVLSVRVVDGEQWIAPARDAKNELYVAERLGVLNAGG